MLPLVDRDWSVSRSRQVRDWKSTARRGLAVVEVFIVLAITFFVIFCVLIVLPRGRETARMATCQKNLMQIGIAVQLYQQTDRLYPTSNLTAAGPSGQSPVQKMLMGFMIPDFLEIRDLTQPPKPVGAPDPKAKVPGLICPSDARAGSLGSSLAISYRANAGDDFLGSTGPFAPGSSISAADVEAGDGLSFTAGFAERLIGTGRDDVPAPANYREQPGPITGPWVPNDQLNGRWRGDAGSSWADPGWRSAIYAHAIQPNSLTTSVATDGRTAALSASSAHPGRINVLMLDGSLRGTTPTINPAVWKSLGAFRSPTNNPEPRP